MRLIRSIPFLAAFAISTQAMATDPIFTVPVTESGMLSAHTGQTLKINIVNLDASTASGCRLTLSLIDMNGDAVGDLVDLPPIQPGTSISQPFVIAGDGVLRTRLDFTPQAKLNQALADPLMGCHNLLPSLELINSDGSHDIFTTTFTSLPKYGKNIAPMNITVCHKPGTPAEQTKVIPVTALKGHKKHGDTIGPCLP